MQRRFALPAVLGLAMVLLAGNAIQAQSVFYGYYYPTENRFVGRGLSTTFSDHHRSVPMWNPLLQRPRAAAPTAPAVPAAGPASVRVIVPQAQAVVWFGNHQTRSTGIERVYQTPALNPGSYDYQLKVSYMQDGQPLALERTITVTPGQTVVVDFTSTATANVKNGQ